MVLKLLVHTVGNILNSFFSIILENIDALKTTYHLLNAQAPIKDPADSLITPDNLCRLPVEEWTPMTWAGDTTIREWERRESENTEGPPTSNRTTERKRTDYIKIRNTQRLIYRLFTEANINLSIIAYSTIKWLNKKYYRIKQTKHNRQPTKAKKPNVK